MVSSRIRSPPRAFGAAQSHQLSCRPYQNCGADGTHCTIGVETQCDPLKTLERVFSKTGLGSRTDARSWIGAGRVRVNGKVVENPDHWVDLEKDRITFDGKPLKAAKAAYILLYKPKGYLTTWRDPEGRPTIYDLARDAGTWLSPVGRLDLDTSGLLLLTNDTAFAERVTNPDHKVPKTYQVKASTSADR